MYSNLIKANYEIKDMNLKELRDRLIKENNLTPLDILKGYHEKSRINLEYESCLTEQTLKDVKTIQKEYEAYILKEGKRIAQEIYDEKFNLLFENYKANCPEASLELANNYNNKDSSISVATHNETWKFIRAVDGLKSRLKDNFKDKVDSNFNLWLKENFSNYSICRECGISRFEGLPYAVDINKEINIDFTNIYESYGHYGYFDDWLKIDYDPHIDSTDKSISLTMYDIIGISVHLSELEAKETFNNAINKIIYNDNSIGELEFFQNLEAQPITINLNTKTGKCELIDGYRRLLYITDENLLKYSAPIRVFTDLDDKSFLALLYAANMWKSEKMFHDRGYLFALKTRFGFEIPSSIYSNLDLCETELSILQLYDFGGNLARVNTSKLMNSLMYHKHLANDISLMYNFLVEESNKSHGYDANISNEIRLTIIEGVGEIRRKPDSDSQNELTEELITSIFEDDFIKKLCAKKHLSTRTYIINYFRDKKIYNHIGDILKGALIKN